MVPDDTVPMLFGVTVYPFVIVAVFPVVTTVDDVLGNVIVVESVPASVKLLLAVNVLPSAIVRVDPVAGAVRVTLLIVVAEATPSVGVTNVGDVAKTAAPDPVSSVKAAARLADEGVPRNVAMPVPRPDTPVEIGKLVQFVSVPDVGVPSTGVVNDGLVVIATLPVPLITYSPRNPALS